MKTTEPLSRFVPPALLLAVATVVHAAPLGTIFSYQGELQDGGAPANGRYDMTFALFNDPLVGAQVGTTWTNLNVSLSNGLFTTTVDFGPGVFDGTAYWLAIGVRSNGSGPAFLTLSPRQALTPSPYALYATAAPLLDGAVTSAKILDGTVAAADLGPNSVNSTHIVDGQVMTVDLAGNAVDSSKVLDGSIQNTDLADNAVNSAKVLDGSLVGADLAANTVTSAQLADNIALGTTAAVGQLDVYKTAAGTPAISLLGTGTGGYQYLYQDDGQIGIYLDGDSGGGGLQYLYAADGSVGIALDGESGGAGLISIYNTNGSARVSLDGSGSGSGGQITVNAQDGSSTVQIYGESGGAGLINVNNNVSSPRLVLDGEGNGGGGEIDLFTGSTGYGIRLFGDSGGGGLQYLYTGNGRVGIALAGESGGAGYLAVYNTNSSTRVALDGFSSNGGGEISVYDANGTESLELLGAYGSTLGGVVRVKQGDGSVGVVLYSEVYANDGGQVSVNNASGSERLELDGDDGDGGAAIRLRNSAGTATITLDGDLGGDGRITTQELQITGGSDLSEQFDITMVEGVMNPGMVVCIDPDHPGQLIPSTQSYDRTVAGVISGAGGVKPGMLMGQRGTAADGKHPVALTGRVYCWADASGGAIRPGDLLTTSDTPGHAMKAEDYQRVPGAILGKAMTSLDQGKGLVLVLVSLQ